MDGPQGRGGAASGPPPGRAAALGSCHQDHLVRLRGLPARTRRCRRGARAGVTGRAPGALRAAVPVPPPDVCCLLLGTLGADAGLGRHPKVAYGWNLAVMCASIPGPAPLGEPGRRMAPSSGRTEARWPAER